VDTAPIKLLILDVDGVLTDGRLVFGPDGEISKTFHARDGCALKLWGASGGKIAILSGRSHQALPPRAKELGIELVHTGIADKLAAYDTILTEASCGDDNVAYVGDDYPDMGPMRRCAFPVAVANASPSVKRISWYVTKLRGGRGAVAEVIELLLRGQGRWTKPLLKSV